MNTDQPSWAENRLLNFLNQAQSAEDIYANENLKDDPTRGSAQGYAIGKTTAQNIIDFRESTPSKQFESVEDILQVPGLGEDKLHDLLKGCAVPADDAYIQSLFKELLGDNWEVTPHIIDYSSDDEFDEVANNAENFRRAVAPLYANTLSYYSSEAKRELEMRIHKAYQENYEEGHIGSFQLAFWWYLFDQDNWFSYENIEVSVRII
ncbi:MAG: helix-hairpin-helix domain-containing protein [Bacteroidia bacterium]|nr:helix-hairpin-helix domain-containing protein [Bacteroidia bacterium]